VTLYNGKRAIEALSKGYRKPIERRSATMNPTNLQTAKVRWIGAQKFHAVSPSGHTLPMDSDRKSNTGPGPMELLLMALGACTATDIVIILEKKRQKLVSLEVICSGERAPEPPQVWTKLEILFRLSGKLEDRGVKQAIQL